MNILFFSDMHTKMFGSIPSWNRINQDGITEEISRFEKSFGFIKNSILQIKPDLVVFLGDIFHSLYSIDVTTLVKTVNCMNEIYEASKQVDSDFWIIPGNHDIRSSGIYSAEIFRCDKFFNDPIIYNYKNVNIGIVPYIDPEHMMSHHLNSFSKKSDVIFTHALFKGSIAKKTDFGFSALYDVMVISGHVHVPQVIHDVYYVGSAHQINPSEESKGIKHGIMTYNTDTSKIVRYGNDRVKEISVIYGSSRNSINKLESSMNDGKFIKLVVTENDFDKLSNIVSDIEYMIVKVPEKQDNKKIEQSEIKSPPDLIKDFFLENHPDLVNDMNSILVECS